MIRFEKMLKQLFAWLAIISYSTIIDFGVCKGFEKLGIIYDIAVNCAYLVAVMIFMLMCTRMLRNRYQMSVTCEMIIGMYLFFAFSSIIHGNPIVQRALLANLCMTILFDIILYNKDVTLFKGIINALNTLAVLNFISIIALKGNHGFSYNYNNGYIYTSSYLLGIDNGHIVTLGPTLCFDLMIYMRTKKKRYAVLSSIIILGTITVFSVTSIIMLFMMFIIYVIYNNFRAISKIIMNRWFLIITFIVIFFLFFPAKGYQWLSGVLTFFFKKDIASSGRARLYPIAFSYIQKSWAIGYGYRPNNTWISGYNSPHNIILNIMLTGGVVGVIFYLSIVCVALKKGKKSEFYCKECKVIFSGIVAYIFASFAEGYDTYVSFYLFWWMCLALCNGKALSRLINSISFDHTPVHVVLR